MHASRFTIHPNSDLRDARGVPEDGHDICYKMTAAVPLWPRFPRAEEHMCHDQVLASFEPQKDRSRPRSFDILDKVRWFPVGGAVRIPVIISLVATCINRRGEHTSHDPQPVSSISGQRTCPRPLRLLCASFHSYPSRIEGKLLQNVQDQRATLPLS